MAERHLVDLCLIANGDHDQKNGRWQYQCPHCKAKHLIQPPTSLVYCNGEDVEPDPGDPRVIIAGSVT